MLAYKSIVGVWKASESNPKTGAATKESVWQTPDKEEDNLQIRQYHKVNLNIYYIKKSLNRICIIEFHKKLGL